MKTVSARDSAVRRVGWLITIWFLSVLALGVFAELMRLLMAAAGLSVTG
ncbi:DUF2474 domain-containing protein [Rhizobium calliandrae]|uniref:DUF2474 domain-containing protein n=1 Tax=Rhizobium calliandrae TaxID=1312182 RepID=A0ABT7KGJ5_9HYPH|nr:DUF2474 domain-containing protein [Rhizobium calliandrae]MDL2407745.1 DUF2474 domain-containing protein [Rhizobium calliandrae]